MSYREKESMGKIVASRLEVVRGWDKKDALITLLPQRLEDNMLYNFRNDIIGGCEGEDVVFHEDSSIIDEASRVTDKLLTTVYAPIEAYFGTDVKVEVAEEVLADDGTAEDGEHPELNEIAQLIMKGKVKKAKKLLKAMSEDHEDYKACKKLIKKAK
jgi:hypothetical protein